MAPSKEYFEKVDKGLKVQKSAKNYLGKGDFHKLNGNPIRMIFAYRKAAKLFESAGNEFPSNGNKVDCYSSASDLYLQTAKIEEAYRCLYQAKMNDSCLSEEIQTAIKQKISCLDELVLKVEKNRIGAENW